MIVALLVGFVAGGMFGIALMACLVMAAWSDH
jgi:hypothetical protein